MLNSIRVPVQENFPKNQGIAFLRVPENVKIQQTFYALENRGSALAIFDDSCNCIKFSDSRAASSAINKKVGQEIMVRLKASENGRHIFLPDVVLPILPKKATKESLCNLPKNSETQLLVSSDNQNSEILQIFSGRDISGQIINSNAECASNFELNQNSGQIKFIGSKNIQELYQNCHGSEIFVKLQKSSTGDPGTEPDQEICKFSVAPKKMFLKNPPIFATNRYQAVLAKSQKLKIYAYSTNNKFMNTFYTIRYTLLGPNSNSETSRSSLEIRKVFEIDQDTGILGIKSDFKGSSSSGELGQPDKYNFQVRAEFVNENLFQENGQNGQEVDSFSIVPVTIIISYSPKLIVKSPVWKFQVPINAQRGISIQSLPSDFVLDKATSLLDLINSDDDQEQSIDSLLFVGSASSIGSSKNPFYVKNREIILSSQLKNRFEVNDLIYLSMDIKKGTNLLYQLPIEIEIVDEDSIPGFVQLDPEYIFYYSEFDAVGTKIGSLDLKKIENLVSARVCLYDSIDELPIIVEDKTGDLKLSTYAEKIRNSVTFSIIALDFNKACPRSKPKNNLTSKITIKMSNENRSAPVFKKSSTSTNIKVKEDVRANSIIGSLDLVDADTNNFEHLSVQIQKGDDQRIFDVKLRTGTNNQNFKVDLIIVKPWKIYSKIKNSYTLQLLAFDGFYQTKLKIMVEILPAYSLPQCGVAHKIFEIENADSFAVSHVSRKPSQYLELDEAVEVRNYDVSLESIKSRTGLLAGTVGV